MEDEEEDIATQPPSSWAILLDKEFQKLYEYYECAKLSDQQNELFGRIIQLMSNILFVMLNNERKLDTFITSGFSLEQFSALCQPLHYDNTDVV